MAYSELNGARRTPVQRVVIEVVVRVEPQKPVCLNAEVKSADSGYAPLGPFSHEGKSA